MRRRVKGKQQNSSMCLVCGLNNRAGLQASFYELDNGELLALFSPRIEHQGYPGRLHGGIASAILDETMGRTIMTKEDEDFWGVSLELTTRFKKPVPLDGEVRVVARLTRNSRRIFEGRGEILLEDGTVAVEGEGRYLKLPLEKIAALDADSEWTVVPSPDDPAEVDL